MNDANGLLNQVETFTRKYGLLVILGLMALEIGLAWRRGEL
jgi:hypothetical protein